MKQEICYFIVFVWNFVYSLGLYMVPLEGMVIKGKSRQGKLSNGGLNLYISLVIVVVPSYVVSS